MWWRILLICFFVLPMFALPFIDQNENGLLAKNKKSIWGVLLGICALIIGQGMYSSYAEKAALEAEVAEGIELRNTIQQHINNRDFRSALALIKSNKDKSFRAEVGSNWTYEIEPSEYVDGFINAGEYEAALDLIQDKVARQDYRCSAPLSKIVLGLYKNGKIDDAYVAAESFIEKPDSYRAADCYKPFQGLIAKHVGDLCEEGKKKEANNLIMKKSSFIYEWHKKELEKMVKNFN